MLAGIPGLIINQVQGAFTADHRLPRTSAFESSRSGTEKEGFDRFVQQRLAPAAEEVGSPATRSGDHTRPDSAARIFFGPRLSELPDLVGALPGARRLAARAGDRAQNRSIASPKSSGSFGTAQRGTMTVDAELLSTTRALADDLATEASKEGADTDGLARAEARLRRSVIRPLEQAHAAPPNGEDRARRWR